MPTMDDTADLSAVPPALPGERRQVSVLFADVVGYTAIIDRLGEERALAFTRMVYDRLAGAVRAQGGVVRAFGGDSVMGVFGLPQAQEDAALRACRAALAIQAAFAAAADDIAARFGERPALRAGISSGRVVMAAVEGDGGPVTAVGNAVNLASRVQALAPEGACLICDATRRLVEWRADLTFDGEHGIKGVATPQKLWRLVSVREGASRFDASRARGLTRHIGRDGELAMLSQALHAAGEGGLRVIDLAAEAGLGKTRLVYEFLQRLGPGEARVLSGHCAPDGQRVPFFPFLEVVRGAFAIRSDSDRDAILRKLDTGLRRLDLHSPENLGLLANLLGLDPPQGTLAGLDGVLIGLRTRDLLPALLAAHCRAGRSVLLLEDVHWIDGASEGLLRGLIEGEGQANLLVLTTRRPEYRPPWLDAAPVDAIALQPLTPGDIGQLVRTRLGVAAVPEALLRQLSERAGGNPLFGEELLSFLTEQGALRIEAGRIDFDEALGQGGIPASMQSLLTARIDALPPDERALLQVAAAIGRRFDPGLLALVLASPDGCGAALRRLQDRDIIHRAAGSSDHVFKHALLRDCVYGGLLADSRTALHLAVADAMAQRNADRLSEAAEALAYHYALTERSDLAFRFSAMAGAKSLGVFSLDAAERYFAQAHALYRRDPGCAGPAAFAALMADYGLCLNIAIRVPELLRLSEEVAPILAQMGDSHDHALFLHHSFMALVCNGRYAQAQQVLRQLQAMAARLGDTRSTAYALVSEVALSGYWQPPSPEAFEATRRAAQAALDGLDDAYLRNYFEAHVGWDAIRRGRVGPAREAAERMIRAGVAANDPRALGYGTAMKALIAMLNAEYAQALELSDRALAVSRVAFERAIAAAARHAALIPLNQPGALEEVERYIDTCTQRGWVMFRSGPEAMLGIGLAMDGRIGAGMAHIRSIIAAADSRGRAGHADWCRLLLCEIHVAVLSGEGETSPWVALKNLRALVHVFLRGEREVIALVETVRANGQFDPEGNFIGAAEMILGLMFKARRKPLLARQHLTEARRIVAPSGPSAMLARIDAALAGLERAR